MICGVRTVGCMWEHSPWKFCAGLTGVWSGCMEKQLFWDSSCDALRNGEHLDFVVLKCSGHSSLVLLWKGHKNNTFLIPNNCNHDFSFWRHTLEFILRWEKHAVPFHRLPLELEFIVLDPSSFSPLTVGNNTSPPLLHCMGAKDQYWLLCLSL
jgi:hypothetical protein